MMNVIEDAITFYHPRGSDVGWCPSIFCARIPPPSTHSGQADGRTIHDDTSDDDKIAAEFSTVKWNFTCLRPVSICFLRGGNGRKGEFEINYKFAYGTHIHKFTLAKNLNNKEVTPFTRDLRWGLQIRVYVGGVSE